MKHNLLQKEVFNIKDLAQIVKKETQTIRSWETKGIIQKSEKKSDNGWRLYTKEDMANVLENILNYNWQRKVIKNEMEIRYIVDFLRGKVDLSEISLMDEEEDE